MSARLAAPVRGLVNILKKPFQPERRLYRLGRSLKNAADDYVLVTKDAATSLRKRPLRLLSLVVGVVGTTAMWRKNPKMDTYLEEIHAYCNELTQCSELTTNPVAKAYIERLLLANCHGNLSYINLGILSILVEKRKNDDCSNFNVTCHHLQPRWWAFHHSIVDIGVWGKWRILEREMVNFDVNEDSLRDLLSS